MNENTKNRHAKQRQQRKKLSLMFIVLGGALLFALAVWALVGKGTTPKAAIEVTGSPSYVLKTTSPEHLIQAVRDVYAGKSALDAAITQKLMAQLYRPDEASAAELLTGRELEVLGLTAKGYTNKAIGMQLGISDRTVQGHLAHVFDKLHARSRTEAVMRAISLGWISQKVGEIAED